ncbi:MAG: electron transfer flavoprotein subunit alpha/FixB family protein, partial [Chloroflexi bacterium]|nr:electron transfer flavoprotein subunit alpha/FixB family protein [Chloroflexota bacterium]
RSGVDQGVDVFIGAGVFGSPPGVVIMPGPAEGVFPVRPGMLQRAEPNRSRPVVAERLATGQVRAPRARIVKTDVNASGGVALDDAQVVIGVGMGVGGPENLGPVRDLAAVLSAPIGATRRAVDAGWFPRQLQVGLTGRSISPRLYVAIGISGKFNHVVGIQRAGLVLAINNNPNADIFKQADYGLVGDWARIVPALTRAFKAASGR